MDVKPLSRYLDKGRPEPFPPSAQGPEATEIVAVEVTFRKGHGTELPADLADLSLKAGLSTTYSTTNYAVGPGVDYSTLIGGSVTILGAAGGIGGIAAVLKVFFERHSGKKVTFGEDGQVLEIEGLSAAEIVRLLDTFKDREEEAPPADEQDHRVIGPGAVTAVTQTPPGRRGNFQRFLARLRRDRP
ncbi:hypothetical protein ACFTXM_49070 [Streptomyces sp. NPDC056930]|uniref:hypothetical protein n=1 Tax=Streptomyces sp. NPDC056930 TaxID=3345967 RepID=UPI003637FF1B